MRTFISCVVVLAVVEGAFAQAPFQRLRNAPLSGIGVGYDVCVGDVDGDGDPDAVVGNDTIANQLLLNDGRGGLVDATVGRLATPAANATHEVDLADIDGDGDLDLLMANDAFLSNRVYLNSGVGVFTDVTATALPTNGDYTMDQVVADFDGDGDVDWLACNNYPPQTMLYLNNGLGVFSLAPVQPPAGASGDNRSFAADLDQDGDLDVVLGRGGFYLFGSLPQVLVNQGNGTFTLGSAGLIPDAGVVYGADIDGDGRVDLLTGDGTRFRRNLGGLTYAAPVTLPSASFAAVDLDLDGDLDLVGSNTYLANSGGVFARSLHGVTLDDRSTCFVDLDGDGDLDAVNSYFATDPRNAMNMLAQIDTPQPLVRGASYTVRFHGGSASAPIFYGHGVAGGSVAIPLPPFGTLRLDPASLVLLDVMVANGTPGSITVQVPNVATLVGQELHHQAIALAPGRPLFLTNAVRDVVR